MIESASLDPDRAARAAAKMARLSFRRLLAESLSWLLTGHWTYAAADERNRYKRDLRSALEAQVADPGCGDYRRGRQLPVLQAQDAAVSVQHPNLSRRGR